MRLQLGSGILMFLLAAFLFGKTAIEGLFFEEINSLPTTRGVSVRPILGRDAVETGGASALIALLCLAGAIYLFRLFREEE